MRSPLHIESSLLRKVWRDRVFRGEAFRICEHFYEQPETGQEFTTTALDTLNVAQVHNAYRVAHQLPFFDEIRALRAHYGLSVAQMDAWLGFAAGAYSAYEHGELMTAQDATRFREVAAAALQREVAAFLWNVQAQPSAYTGYVQPNFERAAQVVLFFAERLQPRKTKLNKLLYYADFGHFAQHGRGISGFNYRAIQHGPVPSHFQEFFEELRLRGYIEIETQPRESGFGEQFIARMPFDAGYFSAAELATLDAIAQQFESVSTEEIVVRSHAEAGWQANIPTKSLISYADFAF
jgi:uncharacterized phage-associated protein